MAAGAAAAVSEERNTLHLQHSKAKATMARGQLRRDAAKRLATKRAQEKYAQQQAEALLVETVRTCTTSTQRSTTHQSIKAQLPHSALSARGGKERSPLRPRAPQRPGRRPTSASPKRLPKASSSPKSPPLPSKGLVTAASSSPDSARGGAEVVTALQSWSPRIKPAHISNTYPYATELMLGRGPDGGGAPADEQANGHHVE